MHFADLDGVTIDAFGTLVRLRDPVGRLVQLSRRSPQAVRAAFQTEMAYYIEHSLEGREETSLGELQRRCTAVFNQAVGAELSPQEYVSTLEYEALEGVFDALTTLKRRGLALAVVANWDYGLPQHLQRLGLDRFFTTVVTSAAVGSAKPDAQIFHEALDRIRVLPERALHVGDSDVDELGAAAAGLRFAPAPLPQAVAGLE